MIEIPDVERARTLCTRIAEDALNRCREEFPNRHHENAAILSVLGYMTGIGDTALKADPMGMGVFEISRMLGHHHGELRAKQNPKKDACS